MRSLFVSRVLMCLVLNAPGCAMTEAPMAVAGGGATTAQCVWQGSLYTAKLTTAGLVATFFLGILSMENDHGVRTEAIPPCSRPPTPGAPYVTPDSWDENMREQYGTRGRPTPDGDKKGEDPCTAHYDACMKKVEDDFRHEPGADALDSRFECAACLSGCVARNGNWPTVSECRYWEWTRAEINSLPVPVTPDGRQALDSDIWPAAWSATPAIRIRVPRKGSVHGYSNAPPYVHPCARQVPPPKCLPPGWKTKPENKPPGWKSPRPAKAPARKKD